MLYLGKKNNKISSANRQLEPLALMAWLLQSLLAPSTLKMVVSNYLIAGQLLNNVCDPLSSNSVSAARAQWLGQYSLSFRMNNSRGSKNPTPGSAVTLAADAPTACLTCHVRFLR